MEQVISTYLLKLRRANPFLATISLLANYRFDTACELFETDARVVRINSEYFGPLTETERTGLLLHLTLHAALLHPIRQGGRDARVWNMAADIVVNNIITEAGDFTPPRQTAVEPKYRDLSVEQVYENLMSLPKQHASLSQAALNMPSQPPDNNQSASRQQACSLTVAAQSAQHAVKQPQPGGQPTAYQIQQVLQQLYPCHNDLSVAKPGTEALHQQTEKQKQAAAQTTQYWRGALRKAEAAARLAGQAQGQLPAGLLREIEQMLDPVMNWRWLLWHFVVRTPDDFEGFDRRFVHQGLYLDQLESSRLKVLVAIDTSGSIEPEELAQFVSELDAIAHAYHFIQIELYYVDADIYGPYQLSDGLDQAPPQGGGGTDFAVFYQQVVANKAPNDLDLIIYFTDGFGEFPPQEPSTETLWVVTAGGLASESFPFGEVARLSIDHP